MQIFKILLDLFCFIMLVVNIYKFEKTESVFDKISFGVYMLFWLLLFLF